MSSAPAQIVANSNNSVVGSSQLQKEFIEEAIPGRSTLNFRQRGNGKVKHLIRSHAMRESTSPPRTPTPRLATDPQTMATMTNNSPVSPTTISDTGADSRSTTQQTQSTSPMPAEATSIPSFVDGSQLDIDFPKLTPPKSKQQQTTRHQNNNNSSNQNNSSSNNNSNHHHHHREQNSKSASDEKNNNINSGNNSNNSSIEAANPTTPTPTTSAENAPKGSGKIETISLTVTEPNHMASQTQAYSPNSDKENRRDNSNHHSPNPPDDRSSQCDSPESHNMDRGSGNSSSGGGNKKNRVALNTKGTKPRLKNNSSSSFEGASSTGFLSRDSSTEQFTDQSGVDLVQFFKETLNKNSKDRSTLISIENELLALASDETRNQVKFPKMSSYNRMLIHRVAAYFGMEHNVDQTQQSVIAAVTKNTRVPDIRFKSLIKDTYTEEPRKSILKRDAHSFDEYRHGLMCPDKDRMLDRKAKSFEEREEEYEKVRRRIFPAREMDNLNTHQWPPWQENVENSHKSRIHNNRLLKVQSVSMDTKGDGRPSVSKAHSFGGYGGHQHGSGNNLPRGDSVTSTKSAGPRLFSKQDSNASTNTPWRLSPSSSGSIYHYDPSNLPPNSIPNQIPYRKNFDKQKPGKTGGNSGGDNGGAAAVAHLNDGGGGSDNKAKPGDDNATVVINESQITKENYTLEENTSLIEKEKSSSHLKLDSPKQKNQATSPNLPINNNENNHSKENNEVHQQQRESPADSCSTPTDMYTQKSCKEVVVVAHAATDSTNNSTPDLNRKDDNKPNKSVPLISFTNPTYQMIENSSMFPGNMAGTPAYQTASDGAIYAMQPQMIYTTYPQSMDAEVPGYFVPVFEQNNGLQSSTGPTLYQNPSTGAVMQYAPSAYNGAPIYQSSVVYAPEQYSNATASNQIQQFPISYPIGYSYPFNGASYQGYWSQPMAYYVPQATASAAAAATNTAGTPIVFPQHASINAVANHNANLSGGAKRNHHHSANTHHGSIPVATFTPNLSMPLQAAESSATTHMYTITQPVYQNMLPYAAAAAPSQPPPPATALSHMPHQPGAVINAPLPPPSLTTVTTAVVLPTTMNAPSSNDTNGSNNSYNPINSTNSTNHNAPSSTPQSTPSTPLSLPVLPTSHSAPKNQPPLFATPPIVPNGFNATPPQQQQTHQPQYGGGNGIQQPLQQTQIQQQQQLLQQPQQASQQYYTSHPNSSSYQSNESSSGGKSYYYNAANKRNYNSQTATTVHNQYNSNRLNNSLNHSTQYGQYPVHSNQSNSNINGQRKYSVPGVAVTENSNAAGNSMQNATKGDVGGNIGGVSYVSSYGGAQQQPHPRNDNTTSTNNNNTNIRKPLIPAIPSSHYNNNNNTINDKSRIQRGPKPANLDLKRNSRNTPSTNSTESNNSPNSITSYTNDHHHPTNHHFHPHQNHQPPQQPPLSIIARNHVPQQMHHQPAVAGTSTDHQPPLISTFNPATGGMYVKFQQPYFAHPSMATALPTNRRSPPNEIRASLAPMYPMMLPAAPRHINPRPPHNPHGKGHKLQR